MAITEVTQLELLNGIVTLIFIVISIIIGFKIIFKYFSTKQIEYLTIGTAWIFLSSGWWEGTLSIWIFIVFNAELSPFLFLFIGNFFIPIALLLWIYSFTHIIFPDLKVKICLIFLVICVSYEIYLITCLYIDTEIIATIERFNSSPKLTFKVTLT